MMRYQSIVLTLFLLASLASSKGEKPKKGSVLATCPKCTDLASSINSFSFDLYKAILETAGAEENIFIGPISITTALSMVLLGAVGNSADSGAKQLEKLLQVNKKITKNGTLDHSIYKCMNDHLYKKTNESTVLRAANKLYRDDGLIIKKSFEDKLKDYYEGGIEDIDFGDAAGSTKTINDWIANKTEDMLQDVLQDGDITAETIAVLINAIYFKGQWVSQFDPNRTKEADFHINGNTTTKVDMMEGRNEKDEPFSFNYFDNRDLKAQMIELRYVGNKFSMVVILPYNDSDLAYLESQLTAKSLKSSVKQLTSKGAAKKVYIKMPRISYKKRYQMLILLKALGLNSSIDLSGISDDSKLQIDKIIHEAAVDINEEGTEASAVTVIIMGRSAGDDPIEFTCDRPFLFLIRDMECGTILFLGRVVDPSSGSSLPSDPSPDPKKNPKRACRVGCRFECRKKNRKNKNKKKKTKCIFKCQKDKKCVKKKKVPTATLR